MDPIARMVAAGAAGASGSSATYVDDVFSTFVYKGTGSSQSLNNGIDLSGEGGLVWLKKRSSTGNHWIFDTERGANSRLLTNTSGSANTGVSGLSFNSNGFTINSDSSINASGENHVMWSFRKAPGFFDVVTYTGTGSAHSISHSLGSVPGMIFYKAIDDSREWMVYHRSLGASQGLILNENYAAFSTSDFGSGPTSTHFSVGNTAVNNTSGKNYIAYIFAHDDQSFGTNEDEAIIKCGSYTGNNSTDGPEIDLGFELQLLLLKRADNADDWFMVDNMRGLPKMQAVYPNKSTHEQDWGNTYIRFTSTGFKLTTQNSMFNNPEEYIYMAIRRPHKPPTAGTEVFAIDNQGTGTMPPQYHSGFPVDMAFNVAFGESQTYRYRDTYSRLNPNRLKFNTTDVQTTITQSNFDFMNGWHANNSSVSTTYSWMFKRAPGFFDVVAYHGTGSTTAHPHNLGVTPELIIVKNRYHPLGYTFLGWPVYNSADGASEVMQLNADDASDIGNSWAHTAPTSTTFTTGTGAALNSSGATYVAYLFASLDGISKVGTYTGTGSAINVDCGFTNGARFVMIKRRDSTGDWYVWDSTRGIVSGNDPYFTINSDNTEVTNTDYIDPLNAGFTVTASGQGDLNANGGTYLFLAIA